MNIYVFSKIIDAMWESIYYEYDLEDDLFFDEVDYMTW